MNEAFFVKLMELGIASTLFLGFFSIISGLLIWLLFRPFWCWYFKINQVTELLSEIRNLLIESQPPQEIKLKYPSLSPDNPRNIYPKADIKIKKDIESERKFETRFGSKAKMNIQPSTPVSSWNIDKPMQSLSDKKWHPLKNK